MIKKAQLRFVAIMMSILFGVFSIIFTTVYYIAFTNTVANVENVINDTAAGFYIPGGARVHSNSIIVTLNPIGDDINDKIKNVWYDDGTFTQTQTDEIITAILSKVHKSGHIDNVYYKLFTNSHDRALLIAVDASDSFASLRQNTISTLFSMVIIYFLLFLLMMKLSWWVLKPLRDSFDKQKQFISNASHELKTPISVISANVDVLAQENNHSQWISNIKSQTTRMSGLVEDMLSLAKLDEGNNKLIFEKFNISDEVLETALPFDAVAFEKGKTLNVEVAPDIIYNGDKQSVKKIVNILLDNAIKHADEKGEITITLKKDNNKTILIVTNSGSHIAAADANKIFERFYRGDSSRSRESGGSGLGLAIAKSIADSNKWKISAVSIPEVSMTITVILQ
ncbi:MAG: HAMP domain-containing histidine kinase [Clostridiales bacterium]|nr:HAMP domain-containing histidine kinase [Clostridiales bacterium]